MYSQDKRKIRFVSALSSWETGNGLFPVLAGGQTSSREQKSSWGEIQHSANNDNKNLTESISQKIDLVVLSRVDLLFLEICLLLLGGCGIDQGMASPALERAVRE